MYSTKAFGMVLLLVFLSGCGDNLFPSGEDKRPVVEARSSGGSVTQQAPDFSVSDIYGTAVTLASSTAGKKGAVLYFTMWCSICEVHMSHLQESFITRFPDVRFYLVDYVSGTVRGAADAATASGYAGGDFPILADVDHQLSSMFQGTMGTTVVIDSTGIVRMNEDFQDGSRLAAALSALQ
jgi:peroxiredoxin